MTSARLAASVAATVIAGCLSGCYDAHPVSGALRCSVEGLCPGGYYCADDDHCWREGQRPDLWTAPATDGAPPDHALAVTPDPDASVPIDLSALAVADASPGDAAGLDLGLLDALADSAARADAARDAASRSDGSSHLPPGEPCRAGGDCLSGFCVDGVCCILSTCAARCTSCAVGLGLACAAVPARAVDPRGQCANDPSRCQSALCDGAGACMPLPGGTLCAPATCAAATLTAASYCDGLHAACPAATANACPGRLPCRDPITCAASCASNAGCVAGSCCRGSACYDQTRQASCGPACLDCTLDTFTGRACIAGGCGCAVDLDCAGVPGKPRCNAATGACSGCMSAADCSPDAPVCDGTHACVRCSDNGDCRLGGWGQNCPGGTAVTCTCTTSTQCADAGGRAKRCDQNGHCACGATGAPCPVGQFCSDASATATCL